MKTVVHDVKYRQRNLSVSFIALYLSARAVDYGSGNKEDTLSSYIFFNLTRGDHLEIRGAAGRKHPQFDERGVRAAGHEGALVREITQQQRYRCGDSTFKSCLLAYSRRKRGLESARTQFSRAAAARLVV